MSPREKLGNGLLPTATPAFLLFQPESLPNTIATILQSILRKAAITDGRLFPILGYDNDEAQAYLLRKPNQL